MTTKFEQIMEILKVIDKRLLNLTNRLQDLHETLMHMDQPPPDVDFDLEMDEEITRGEYAEAEPRTRVQVQSPKETYERNWNDLPEDIQQAIEISRELDLPYTIHEGASGQLQIAVDQKVKSTMAQRKLGDSYSG